MSDGSSNISLELAVVLRDRVLIALGVVRGTMEADGDLSDLAMSNLRDLLKDVADELAESQS